MEPLECPFRESGVKKGGQAYEACQVMVLTKYDLRSGRFYTIGDEDDDVVYAENLEHFCRHCKVPRVLTVNPCQHLEVGFTATELPRTGVISSAVMAPQVKDAKTRGACVLTRKKVNPMKCNMRCSNYNPVTNTQQPVQQQPVQQQPLQPPPLQQPLQSPPLQQQLLPPSQQFNTPGGSPGQEENRPLPPPPGWK